MLLLFAIIITAVFFYIRFFILNALATAASRKATLFAALKATYFIPLLLQGLILLRMGVTNFFSTCRGFLVLFNYWVYETESDALYNFLYLLSYIVSASMLLSLHYILGKISLNKKTDLLHIFYKAVYITASYFIIQVMLLNADLVHPIAPYLSADIVVLNQPHVILLTVSAVVAVTVFSFCYKNHQSAFRYIQLSVLISTGYIAVCLLTGILLFLLHTILKFID